MLWMLIHVMLAVLCVCSRAWSMPFLSARIKFISVFTWILAVPMALPPPPPVLSVLASQVTPPTPLSVLASQVAPPPPPLAPSALASQLALLQQRVRGIDTKKDELMTELESYNEEIVSSELRRQREPKYLLDNLKKNLVPNRNSKVGPSKNTENAVNKILTLKAYLDEAERDLFLKNWDNLQVYLYTFADQEDSFAYLIDNLFPQNNNLDRAARDALSYEAQSMFLALDELRESAKMNDEKLSQRAYSKLLLSYDRFLKAGDLYPTYDPITSTEVFFYDTPLDTLRYDRKARIQVLDEVLLTQGPDMGKTGTVINIDDSNSNDQFAVVKLDKDGKAYQEVKYVKLSFLAKTIK